MKKTIHRAIKAFYKTIFVLVCALTLTSTPLSLTTPASTVRSMTTQAASEEDSNVDEGLYGYDVCFNSMGGAMYYYSGRACDPRYAKGVKWSEFPLKVFIEEKDREHIQTGVVKAIAHIETITGKDLFMIVDKQTSDVKIFISYTYETYPHLQYLLSNTIGLAGHYYDRQGNLACDVVFIKKFEDEPQTFIEVVIHELGHALGLRHDGIKDSIMYPSIGDNQKFTEHDIKLLRGL